MSTTFPSKTVRKSASQAARDCIIRAGRVFGMLGLDAFNIVEFISQIRSEERHIQSSVGNDENIARQPETFRSQTVCYNLK